MTGCLDLVASTAGFFGKVPARGDFVSSGLPRSFTGPWDAWLQTVIAGSQDVLGQSWMELWLEAPIWCFGLPPGACGAGSVLGVWMPSVDRAGRYFPLTIAAIGEGPWPALAAVGGGFMRLAVQAGLDAIANDTPPEELARRIDAALRAPGDGAAVMPGFASGAAGWWTDGNAVVAAQNLARDALPDVAAFVAMLAGAVSK